MMKTICRVNRNGYFKYDSAGLLYGKRYELDAPIPQELLLLKPVGNVPWVQYRPYAVPTSILDAIDLTQRQ